MKSKDSALMWIPLWVDKWLWGSTRIELEPDERSVWVDLMALAAKDDGYIRANVGVPYAHQQLAGMLCVSVESWPGPSRSVNGWANLQSQRMKRFSS